MSSYLNYYIEYRPYNSQVWKFLQAYVPKESLDYPECHEQVVADGDVVCKICEDSIQGYVRDVFSTHGWVDAPFTGRGFPKDISVELKDYIEREKLREWEDQKKNLDPDYEYDKNFQKVPRKEPLSIEKDFMDYKYDKTYATLEELDTFYEKELFKAKKKLENYHNDDAFEKINKRFDAFEFYVKTGTYAGVEKESKDDDIYNELSDLEENISDIELFGGWIRGINMITDFLTCSWNDRENIRVITYIS